MKTKEHGNKGKHVFNNGSIAVRSYECPEGFKPGRIKGILKPGVDVEDAEVIETVTYREPVSVTGKGEAMRGLKYVCEMETEDGKISVCVREHDDGYIRLIYEDGSYVEYDNETAVSIHCGMSILYGNLKNIESNKNLSSLLLDYGSAEWNGSEWVKFTHEDNLWVHHCTSYIYGTFYDIWYEGEIYGKCFSFEEVLISINELMELMD